MIIRTIRPSKIMRWKLLIPLKPPRSFWRGVKLSGIKILKLMSSTKGKVISYPLLINPYKKFTKKFME